MATPFRDLTTTKRVPIVTMLLIRRVSSSMSSCSRLHSNGPRSPRIATAAATPRSQANQYVYQVVGRPV